MNLGSFNSGGEVDLDLDALIGTHACIVGNSGSGKSGLIRRLLEQTHGRVHQIVIDPEDEFYTLRQAHDFLIAGGDEGDCPATVKNAAELATTLLTHSISAVIQINSLGSAGQEAFVDRFLRAMITAPRALWHPTLVVLDEAHRWAPQEGRAESSEAMRDLISLGRKRGFTAIMATQRISKIDKNLTGEANNWFFGRVGQATDRRVAADALGFSPSSKEARELQGMEPRTFWAFGPAVCPVPQIMRVGDAETTMVKAGQAHVPTPPPPEAMRGLLQALRTAAKVETSDTPSVAGAAVEPLSEAAREAIRDQAHRAGYLAGHGEGVKQGFSGALGELRPVIRRMEAMAYGADAETGELKPVLTADEGVHSFGAVDAPPQYVAMDLAKDGDASVLLTSHVGGSKVVVDSALKITPSLQKILDALAYMDGMRRRGGSFTSRSVLGFLVGMSPNGGGFRNYLSALVTAGLLSKGSDSVALTEAGAAIARAPRLISNTAVQEAALARISPREGEMLKLLIGEYPNSVTKIWLAQQMGMEPTGGGFRNYMGHLKSLEMAFMTTDLIRATALLFPENS